MSERKIGGRTREEARMNSEEKGLSEDYKAVVRRLLAGTTSEKDHRLCGTLLSALEAADAAGYERGCEEVHAAWATDGVKDEAAAEERGKKAGVEMAMEAVRVNCGPCGGTGVDHATRTVAVPGDDGEPMPLEVDDSTECPYCGYPIAAIRALALTPTAQEKG